MKNLYFILPLVIVLAGCANPARKLTIHLDQEIASYENAIDAKANAEQQFYQNQLATIRQYMGGNSAITMGTNPVATVTSVISDPNRIHQTLPYGRIATHAQRDARIAAEQITTSQSPMVMATIMEYLDNGLNQEQGDYLDYIQRQRQLQNGFNGTLAGIAEQKQKLADVRKGLASLAATPDDITQLKMLYAFGVGVRNQLSNTNSLPPKKQ